MFLHHEGIGTPSGFAIDWISNNIFISVNSDQEPGEALIVACNLIGQYFTVIFNNKLSSEQEGLVSSLILVVTNYTRLH